MGSPSSTRRASAGARAPRRARRPGALAIASGLALALAAACRDPTAGPGWLSGSRPPLPTYRAPRAAGPVQLDGRLDERAWSDAPRVELVRSLDGLPPAYRTEARITWDDEALLVALVCDDDEAWVRPRRVDDDALWEDEVVELFLDPSGHGRDYLEVEVSPGNVRFDARFATYRSDLARARAWSSGARSAVAVDGALTVGDAAPVPARRWTVELALPWRTLGISPRPGARWRMNLYRLETHNRRRLVEGSAFSPPLRPDFHATDRFGWLELAGPAR